MSKREIKFRAWDAKNKNWVDEGVSHHDIDEEASIYFYPDNPLGDDFDGRIIYQQYTGLKDKDGKEIWEGDILKIHGKYYDRDTREDLPIGNQEVKWVTDDRRFGQWHIGPWSSYPVEVIGNIFEDVKND